MTAVWHLIKGLVISSGNNLTYKNNDSFLGLDIIDPTGVLELVRFVEKTFKIWVEDEEIIPQNLDSIDSLVAFITSKTG